jgi:hypothetical protein
MKDINGRPYALVSEVATGDKLEVDGDFDCFNTGDIKTVFNMNNKLYIICNDGEHYIEPNIDGEEPNEYYIGFYKVII